jgi:hypothetical protein
LCLTTRFEDEADLGRDDVTVTALSIVSDERKWRAQWWIVLEIKRGTIEATAWRWNRLRVTLWPIIPFSLREASSGGILPS